MAVRFKHHLTKKFAIALVIALGVIVSLTILIDFSYLTNNRVPKSGIFLYHTTQNEN